MIGEKDRRIIKEGALLIIPTIARVIGLNEAIILQQIHYWLQIAAEKGNNFNDGYYWTYNSVREWAEQFPFWHQDTIRRALNRLIEQKLLITANYNKLKYDRTKWYRINYKKLCQFLQNAQIEICNSQQCHLCNLHEPLPDISLPDISLTDNSSTGTGNFYRNKNSIDFFKFKRTVKEKNGEYLKAMEYFIMKHNEHFGAAKHPKLKPKTWHEQLRVMEFVKDEARDICFDVCYDDLKLMIENYFNKKYQGGCNYCITHFNNPGIKIVNFYESAYYGNCDDYED